MSPSCPDRITLTGSQRRALARLVRAGRTEQRLVTRAQIVLAAAEGQSNARIAASLRVCEDTVRKWRRRWCAAPGVASLRDAQRCGRPPVFSAVQVAKVKAAACTPPADCRVADVAVELPGAGAARRRRGDLRVDLDGDGAPLAVRGRPQTLAVPVVDLHHRSRLRRQSQAGARPLRPGVGRETTGRQRLCDLRRREDLHPGPVSLPPHAARPASPARCGSTTTTTAAARSPTWPPTTCTAPRCSAAASRPPASNRSADWSNRS